MANSDNTPTTLPCENIFDSVRALIAAHPKKNYLGVSITPLNFMPNKFHPSGTATPIPKFSRLQTPPPFKIRDLLHSQNLDMDRVRTLCCPSLIKLAPPTSNLPVLSETKLCHGNSTYDPPKTPELCWREITESSSDTTLMYALPSVLVIQKRMATSTPCTHMNVIEFDGACVLCKPCSYYMTVVIDCTHATSCRDTTACLQSAINNKTLTFSCGEGPTNMDDVVYALQWAREFVTALMHMETIELTTAARAGRFKRIHTLATADKLLLRIAKSVFNKAAAPFADSMHRKYLVKIKRVSRYTQKLKPRNPVKFSNISDDALCNLKMEDS